MPEKIESITPEQEARFPEWVAKWRAIGNSTEPADFERAKKAAHALYKSTESKIPEIINKAFSELMYFPRFANVSPSAFEIFIKAIATAAPKSSKTIETVVEVGIPKVLKKSNNSTSVIITAIKMIMISLK